MSGGITSLAFTETMRGRVTFGVEDPVHGASTGGDRRTAALLFRLTIEVMDVDRFVVDPRLEASARGYVRCEALGGQLPVEHGVFNLFVPGDRPDERRMLYRLHLHDGAGHPLTLTGHKEVHDGPGFDLWADTTTLYVRLLRGFVDEADEAEATVVAAGVLRIRLLDFLRQLTTFRAYGPHAKARVRALASFGRLFLGHLWDVYRPAVTRRKAA
jgi:cholesterol oxidase